MGVRQRESLGEGSGLRWTGVHASHSERSPLAIPPTNRRVLFPARWPRSLPASHGTEFGTPTWTMTLAASSLLTGVSSIGSVAPIEGLAQPALACSCRTIQFAAFGPNVMVVGVKILEFTLPKKKVLSRHLLIQPLVHVIPWLHALKPQRRKATRPGRSEFSFFKVLKGSMFPPSEDPSTEMVWTALCSTDT
ncbi:unnamed protein product [Caretta caretta]